MTIRKAVSSGSAVFDFVATQAWALQREVLNSLSAVAVRHLTGERISQTEVAAIVEARDSSQTVENDGPVVRDGVAVIPMAGVIAKHASQVGGSSQPRGTSIETLRAQFRAAMDDPAVKAILFNVDSPGGSVDGVPTFADEIRAARGQGKPIWSFSNDLMASAAYWLSSQTDRIVGTRESRTGSIGVYTVVDDLSRRAANSGVDVHVISSGGIKGAGVPGSRISRDAINHVQKRVDEYAAMFIDAVAQGRGVDDQVAKDWADGRDFMGEEAMSVGLIDAVATFDAVLAELAGISGQGSAGPSRSRAAFAAASTDPAGDMQTMEPTRQGAGSAPAAPGAVSPASAANQVQAPALTLESLRTNHPDLAAMLIAEGRDAERARATEIVETIQDAHREITVRAIKEGMSVKDAVKAAYADGRRMKSAIADKLDQLASAPVGTPSVEPSRPAPAAAAKPKTQDEQWQEDYAADERAQREFASFDLFKSYKKAMAAGAVRMVGKAGV